MFLLNYPGYQRGTDLAAKLIDKINDNTANMNIAHNDMYPSYRNR